MHLRILLRLSLAIVFGFIGVLIARTGTPTDIFAIFGKYFLLIAVLAFGILGLILPDIIELAGKAGIVAFAEAVSKHLPNPASAISSAKIRIIRPSGKNKYANPLIVDTSVLIDGRIADIAKAGFVMGELLIIPSVVGELHRLSDSADDLKRAKGRRGLDMLSTLQHEKGVKVIILNTEPKEGQVDEKLVRVAKNLKGQILTIDFNLNKVARVRKVKVANINELANAVKTVVLPHEVLSVQIKTAGKEKEQGVGYLEDGTMVVVENGAKLVGKTVKIEVLRVLQTAAGKMIFGRIK